MPGLKSAPTSSSANPARLDRWLWAVRIFKTRALAATACRHGKVRVEGQVAKPARALREGETITVRHQAEIRTLVVRAWPASRVGAKLVSAYCEDRTPPRPRPEEAAGSWQFGREPGRGRPTKRDRRRLEDLRDRAPPSPR